MTVDQLAGEIVKHAKACDLTLVTAESCTAGAVAHTLSQAPGAGDVLEGGFITYRKDMKNEVLGVPMRLLVEKSAVCEEVARAMALGALELAPADLAVAVTGVAGPEPDEDGNPVGLVHVAAARLNGPTLTSCHHFEGSREAVVNAAVKQALVMLDQICKAP